MLNKTQKVNYIKFVAIIIILSVFMIFYIPRLNFSQWYRFPLGIPDREFIPRNYIETISFLRKSLDENEGFFTMTSEASWYYFISKPCPTRFPVVWFAMPYFYQNEIVDDLRKRNVKFILYRNVHWANEIDGFSNEIRLPIVVEYIKQKYVFF